MAEGILKEKAKNLNFEVDSAGTAAYHVGENPDPRSVMTCRKHKVDISKLLGRQFTVEDFDRFDRIYVMDESNLKNVLKLARNEHDVSKVSLLLDEISDRPKGMEVPDPYYGGADGFENVYAMIEMASEAIVKKYEQSH